MPSGSNLLTRVAKNFAALSTITGNRTTPAAAPAYAVEYLTLEPYGSTTKAKSRELAALYNASPWVRSIVGRIADEVAKPKWFFENTKGERIDEHPALTFLRAGCPGLRGKKALKVLSSLYDLQGEVFLVIGRDARGVPVQWAPIPSHWVIDTPSISFNGFRVQPRTGAVVDMKVEDVLWIRDPDPVDPYTRGSSLTGAIQTEVYADEAAAEFFNAFFKNRARPDIIVTGTETSPITEDDHPRLQASWLQKFSGAGKAFRPLFSSKPLEIKEVKSGLADVAVENLREMGRKIIAEFYGVPPEIFGRLDSSNKATIKHAREIFGRYVTDPRRSTIRDEFEEWLSFEFNTAGLTLSYDALIEDDIEFALSVITARPAAFSNDEVRALAKHKPLGGKHAEVFDPVDPADMTDPEGGPGGGKDDEDTEDDKSKAVDVIATTKAIDVTDAINVSSAHEDPEVRVEATKLTDEIFAELLQKFGSELLESLSVEANFQAAGRVAEFIADEVPELLGQVDETTRKELRASLAEGVAKSESVEKLIARVDAVFAEASKIRASTIGDTVATKIAGFASQVAAEEAGFPQKKWLSTRDQLVRGTHAGLDGQIVGTNRKFKSPSGAEASHPGAFGVASEDINCRCAMRPVIDGEETRAVDTDAEYLVVYERQWGRTAKALRGHFKTIFAAQREVVVEALKRANRT
jgi:HK97 family phage portal protein